MIPSPSSAARCLADNIEENVLFAKDMHETTVRDLRRLAPLFVDCFAKD
jgi:hypothetical protein